MTAKTARIRWNENPSFATVAISGYVGTVPEAMFAIFSPDGFDSEWLLATDLPGMSQKRFHASDPDGDSSEAIAALKAEAEEWLAAFAASIGATFGED